MDIVPLRQTVSQNVVFEHILQWIQSFTILTISTNHILAQKRIGSSNYEVSQKKFLLWLYLAVSICDNWTTGSLNKRKKYSFMKRWGVGGGGLGLLTRFYTFNCLGFHNTEGRSPSYETFSYFLLMKAPLSKLCRFCFIFREIRIFRKYLVSEGDGIWRWKRSQICA